MRIRHQRVQILGNRAFAHQDMHALADLFERFFRCRALVVGADTGRQIAVEIKAAQQRRMAVDMAVLKGVELGQADRVLVDDAGKIHEFRQPDDLLVVAEGQEFFDRQAGARGFQMGGRDAA